MGLEEMIIKLAPYNIGCKTVEGYFLVSLTFDKTWQIVKPDNDNVECGIRNGVCYYSTPIGENGIQEIFDSINETIQYNENLAKKLELFETKVRELQELFTDEDLEVLKTLSFKLKRTKKQPSKKIGVAPEQLIDNVADNEGTTETTENTADPKATVSSLPELEEEVTYQEVSEEPTDGGDNSAADALLDQFMS